MRFLPGHNARGARRAKPLEERFWTRVRKGTADECWEWTGSRTSDGYGTITDSGRVRVASRVAWELERGPIPEGMLVCHRCDNPPCCNPAHLFVGSHADNHADREAKARGRWREGIGGRTPAQKAAEVARMRSEGKTYREIASYLGISVSYAHRLDS